MQVQYETINTLSDFQFIGGSLENLEFVIYDENGSPLSLAGAVCTWNLCVFGIPNVVELTKTGTITGTNTFLVQLLPGDTSSISGKFIQQPVITIAGAVYIPAQGTILITPKIQ